MPDRNAKVVIVAPGNYFGDATGAHELEGHAKEVAEVVSTFYRPALVHASDAVEDKIAEKLRGGADGFWFVGHAQGGDHMGLLLADGILGVKALGQYLARAGVKWVFLNACETSDLVDRLQQIHPCDVYANIVSRVSDADATRNGILFAQGIAAGGNIRAAYRVVVGGAASSLRFFPSPYPSPDALSVAPAPASPNTLMEASGTKTDLGIETDKMERRIARMERIVWGDPDMGVPAWVQRVEGIETTLQRMVWGMVGIGLMIGLSILFLIMRVFGGI